ncbi:hypothetical protein FOZ60_005311 [Perkinsus olseni]|uniref:Uncharacterized protein n=1 Tax=Perkinsus olseni TaxID=32597 RepID=A0A7J6NSD4_PEROL|nr:hypothetical protein FOZ60_005311 [Perkinsus olseni]
MRSRLRSLILLFGVALYTLVLTVNTTQSLFLWLGGSSSSDRESSAEHSLAALDDRLLAAHSKALDAYVNCVARDAAASSDRACRREAMGIFDTVAAETRGRIGAEERPRFW